MPKVYIVRSLYHEQYSDPNECPYAGEIICEVFDSMEKAVSYIHERFKIDHELADARYSSENGRLIKQRLPHKVMLGEPVEVLEYEDDELHIWEHYMVDSYDVK